MSKLVGDRLPSEVQEAFNGEQLEAKIGPAYLLVTTDPDGAPRPCMLSAGEVFAPDDRRIRVALWPGTRTSGNLGRGVPALFCFVAPGAALYIRGRSRRLPKGDRTRLEHFEIQVDSVESDMHKRMPVTEGITFGVQAMDPAEVLESWQAQIQSLRED
jgi:hypothetical protein